MVIFKCLFTIALSLLVCEIYTLLDKTEKLRKEQLYLFSVFVFLLMFFIDPIIHGVSLSLIAAVLYIASMNDIKHYEIPDITHVLLFVLGLFSGYINTKNILIAFLLISSFIGLVTLFNRSQRKEGMGGGDLKLFLIAFMYFDLYTDLWLIMLSCTFGIIQMLIGKVKIIAFCPAISLAMMVMLLI